MDGGDSILNSIFEEGDVADYEDIEMLDVEEGELVEQESRDELAERKMTDVHAVNQASCSKNQRKKKNKRKNKRKRGSSSSNITDVNRFVLDICKHLKEKKSYLVWTAVGCLGVSALGDLVKEVDAIQACGGQKTTDGRRYRTGGGILWNILKVRDPNAYKEIMKKGKEFEKQFRQPNIKQDKGQINEAASQETEHALTVGGPINGSGDSRGELNVQSKVKESNGGWQRASIHDRIRMPVRYDDLLPEDPGDKPV